MSCVIPDIPQGAEGKFTITLKNKQLDPIVLSSLDHGYIVWVYSEPGNPVVKFSSVALAGHILSTVISDTEGKFQIKIDRNLTAVLPPNTYKYEVKTEITDGLGSYMPGKTGISLFRIVVGQAKTLLSIS